MSTVDNASSPVISAVVDPTNFALRVSLRGLEYNNAPGNQAFTGGHYKINGSTAAIAPASNAFLAAARYAGANLAVISRIYALIDVATVVTTAQRVDPLSVTIARAYSATETAAYTAVLPAAQANTGKMRTSMGTPAMLFGVASAAAGVSGGTRTLDSAPIGTAAPPAYVTPYTVIGETFPAVDLYKWDQHGQSPLVLAQNEGFLVQWGTTALASGTIVVTVGVDWAEVPSF